MAEGRSQVSIRIPVGTLADLDRISKALDRDRSWVMLRAFQTYIEGEGHEVLEEATGIEQLDAGKSVDFDAVMEKAEAIVAEARRSARQAKVG